MDGAAFALGLKVAAMLFIPADGFVKASSSEELLSANVFFLVGLLRLLDIVGFLMFSSTLTKPDDTVG